jgi:hypothetical protein
MAADVHDGEASQGDQHQKERYEPSSMRGLAAGDSLFLHVCSF